MKKLARIWAICCALALIGSSAAFAAQDQAKPEVKLPDTSVSATRWEQNIEKLPRNVDIITREYIEKVNPMTVPDLLKGLPGIYVQELNGYGTQATVTMRGFGENGGLRVLVTVDGRRQNLLDLNGHDWSTIPVENIERIEILHGAAGVVYGDNAVGGVINIITRRGKGPMKGSVRAQYGSHDMYGFAGNFDGSTEMVDWFVSARYDDSEGYRENNQTRVKGGYFNAAVTPNKVFSIRVDGAINETDFGVPGSITVAQADRNRTQTAFPNAYYDNKNQAIAALFTGDFQKCGVLTLDLAYRKWQSESDYWAYYDQDAKYYAVQPKYVLDSDFGSLANRVTAGIDYYKWDLEGTYVSSWTGTANHDNTLNSFGAYLLDEFSITKNIVFQAGARYQKQDYTLETTPVGSSTSKFEPDDDRWAWTAGVAWNFMPGSKVFGRVASAFRYPSIDEYSSVSATTFWEVEPEKSLTYELGVEWAFMTGARVGVTAYLMNMEDEIAYNSLTWANENLDDTRHQGVEASLHVPVCKWAYAFGSLTYQDAEFTKGANDGKTVPLVPEWMASIGVNVEPITNLNILVRWMLVGERYYGGDYGNVSEKMDAFNTFDASVSYKYDRFKVFFNAKNIFSEKYSTSGWYGYSTPDQNTVNPMPEAEVWGGIAIEL